MATPANLLLTNGRFLPHLDGQQATWMRVVDGRIAALGLGEPEGASGVNTATDAVRHIDLQGRLVTPGFHDAHVHLTWIALAMLGPDVSGATNVDELVATVAAWDGPGRGPEGAWIVGDGFDETTWKQRSLPTRDHLDAIGGDRPILVKRVCGHVSVGNSAALAQLPDGVHTDRQSGRVAEDDLWALNDRLRPDADAFHDIWPRVQQRLHENGITAVHDVASLQMIEALQRWDAQNALQVRITTSVPAANRAALTGWRRNTTPSDRLRFLGLKVFTDGSLGAHTAHLRQAYADAPETRGTSLYDTDTLRHVFRDAVEQDWQLMVHAIGDAALDEVLQELAPVCTQGNPLQHRLEHLEVTPPDVVDRLVQTGAWACVQPNFARRWSQPGGMNEQRLGPERMPHCNAYRTLMTAGIPMTFGSDCMPLGALYGIQAAVHHPLPGERLTPEQALDFYTRTPAQMCFGETDAGTLQPGSAADLTILDGDPFDPDGGARVAATILAGDVVWAAADADGVSMS